MPTVADLEERAIWKLEQAGYAVTIQPLPVPIDQTSIGQQISK